MHPLKRFAEGLSARRIDRGELAASLRRVARGEVEPPRLGHRLAAPRPQVEEARAELESLAARLAGPEPIDRRGVDLTRELLSDGAGPLFWAGSEADLRTQAREALAALGPRIPVAAGEGATR
jgi:hypothetical protein